MPSNKPQIRTVDRPSPKERAVGLREAAARAMPGTTAAGPLPVDDLNPRLATLVDEHAALVVAVNEGRHPDIIAEALLNQSDDRFRQACAIPALTPADFRAKLQMILPELRRGVGDLAGDLHVAVDCVAADAQRLTAPAASPSASIQAPAEYGGLPDPEPVAADFSIDGLSMRDLMHLHDAILNLIGYGNAVLCQPRCEIEQQGTMLVRRPVGRLVEWVNEVAGHILARIQATARQRLPTDETEIDHRLSILAGATATNGDPAEMRAFARDLEAQAGRIEARG